ncbi:MAG: ABC transporter permease [Clostridiales bacterium]|nr:ABC transporter permease [Clostridiales bacterium]
MTKYIIGRILRSVITLFLIITAVFILLRLMPVEGYFNNYEKMSPTQVRVGLANLGLNRPIHIQLFTFLKNILGGDLGISNRYRVKYPIIRLIASKMPLSVEIGLMAVCLGLAAGIPLGILMSRSARSGSRLKLWDKIGTVVVVLVEAIPASVYYLFIQIYGTELLNKFIPLPTLFDRSKGITWALPVVSLSLGTMAWCAMWIRRYMVDESTKDYVMLARAKGVPASAISRSHIFRNAFVPIVQGLPSMLLLTLVGSLYVESRYSIPGMGGLLVDVIKRQDNTVVQALVLVYSAVSILGLLLGDIAMALLDPRIRLAGKGETR